MKIKKTELFTLKQFYSAVKCHQAHFPTLVTVNIPTGVKISATE